MIDMIAAAATNGMMAAVTCLAFAGTIAAALIILAFIVSACKAFVGVFNHER